MHTFTNGHHIYTPFTNGHGIYTPSPNGHGIHTLLQHQPMTLLSHQPRDDSLTLYSSSRKRTTTQGMGQITTQAPNVRSRTTTNAQGHLREDGRCVIQQVNGVDAHGARLGDDGKTLARKVAQSRPLPLHSRIRRNGLLDRTHESSPHRTPSHPQRKCLLHRLPCNAARFRRSGYAHGTTLNRIRNTHVLRSRLGDVWPKRKVER